MTLAILRNAIKNATSPVTVTVDGQTVVLPASDLRAAIGNMVEWCYPVGDVSNVLYPPPRWTRTNWVGASYVLNGKTQIHTGDDLGLPGSEDVGIPVRAVHDGVVIFAGIGSGTWGNLVVIRHDMPDGTFFYSRSAHMLYVTVKAGNVVLCGDVIGSLGHTGGGAFSPHLHFDITKIGDSVLLSNPQHWPGANAAEVSAHYVDPGVFLKDKIAPVEPPSGGDWFEVVSATGLNVRTEPRTTASRIMTLPDRTEVRVLGQITNGAYTWGTITECPSYPMAVGGYVARNFLALKSPKSPTVSTKFVGHHLTDGSYPSGLLEHLERLANGGTPIPVMTVINLDPSPILQVSPQTHVIWRRVNGHNDPAPYHNGLWTKGADWFYDHRAAYDAVWAKVKSHGLSTDRLYAQWANEWWMGNQTSIADAQRYSRFYLDLVETAYAIGGYRSTWGDFAFGNVNDGSTPTEPNHISAMREMFELADMRARGGVICPLNYHAYGKDKSPYNIVEDAKFWALRWVNWIKPYPHIRFIGGEAGIPDVNNSHFLSVENTMTMIKDLDRLTNEAIQKDKIKAHQVLGYCWWSLGSDPKWVQFDYRSALPSIEQYYRGV